MSAQYHAADIADYFLWKAHNGCQELLSNMKLQKLLYYAQGLHLALYDTPLFNEKIEAWTYGPVVTDLYHTYEQHEARGIPANPGFNPQSIDKNTKEFLDEVFDAFGQFSATRLMEIALTDQCCKDAKLCDEITCNSMRKSLKKYIKNG